MKAIKVLQCMTAVVCLVFSVPSHAARVKDIAGIGGVRDNQLIGYGLAVGLAGTGDDVKNGFTKESLSNLLSRQGLAMKDKALKSSNTAAVMVTALLPPFAKIGTKVDIVVSSIGDAKSLLGGTLLMTTLHGADGEVYAVAQGPVTLGGFTAGGAGGGGAVKNHPNVGRVTNGAMVERELKYEFEKSRTLTLNLLQPDFTTAMRLTSSINKLSGVEARQSDSSSVAVKLSADSPSNIFDTIYLIENMEIPVDNPAVVVMNEKTGTVVMGENVRISTVAIAHGNLSIQIKEEAKVSQPLPFSPTPLTAGVPAKDKAGDVIVAPGGQTVVTMEKNAVVTEEKKQLVVVSQGVTIQDVVKALNAMGVTPRDLITILQTIKAAGALQADLRII